MPVPRSSAGLKPVRVEDRARNSATVVIPRSQVIVMPTANSPG